MQKLEPVGLRSANGVLVFVILSFLVFASVFVFIGASTSDSNSIDGLIFLVIGGFFAIIMLVIALFAYRRYRIARLFLPPDFTIDRMVHVGDSFHLQYQQGFRKSVDLQRYTCELLLIEVATYQAGTNTATVSHDEVFETMEFPPRHYSRAEIFTDDRELHIPADAMHSFESNHNKIEWRVRLKIKLQDGRKYERSFALHVSS